MTQQELTALNPWAKYPNYKGVGYRFYYEDTDLIHPLDKEIIDEYNNGRARQYRFERHVPPFPFQGNPLCAKVVFLSLNPVPIAIFCGSVLLVGKWKVSPILIMIGAGIIGALLCG